MSAIIVPTLGSIAAGNRRQAQFMAALYVALNHVRTGVRTVSDLLESRFAEFAGVPYQNPLSRQQWKDLWETEAKPDNRRS